MTGSVRDKITAIESFRVAISQAALNVERWHQPDVAADATHQRRRAVEEPDVEAELDEEERRGERDAGEGRDELAAVEDE
jgi:hypothetical protein